jgi:hypothetical protein
MHCFPEVLIEFWQQRMDWFGYLEQIAANRDVAGHFYLQLCWHV